MRIFALTIALIYCAVPALADVTLSPERQSFLEGEWHGVTVDTNANRLCEKDSPPSTVFSFEFARSGGVAFLDNGQQAESGRRKISAASENGALIEITLAGQTASYVFRPDGPNVMALVRNSASLGLPVDVMMFKRCRAAADRTNIVVGQDALRAFAAEMPSEMAYFVDARIAAKVPDACNAAQVQYLFLSLLGPSEFRVSRWNSFDLADALEAKKQPKFPLDSIGNWLIQSAREKDGGLALTLRDYEKADAKPFTLTVQRKGDGRIAIPEWTREYVRCKGFDKRS